MSEHLDSPETNHYTREQIVEMFKALPKEGIKDPVELSVDDPNAIAAYDAYFDWNKRESQRAGHDEKAILEHSLSTTILHYEAGFRHPDYLDEVANDWLAQDLENAELFGFTELAGRIKAKINEINRVADSYEVSSLSESDTEKLQISEHLPNNPSTRANLSGEYGIIRRMRVGRAVLAFASFELSAGAVSVAAESPYPIIVGTLANTILAAGTLHDFYTYRNYPVSNFRHMLSRALAKDNS